MPIGSGEETPVREPLEEKPKAESQESNIKEFTLTAKKWKFIPDTITVNKGDVVKLTITSIDVDHGFAINAFDVDTKLEPGKTTTVTFTADIGGTHTFYCSIYCGSGHTSMNGQLIVE